MQPPSRLFLNPKPSPVLSFPYPLLHVLEAGLATAAPPLPSRASQPSSLPGLGRREPSAHPALLEATKPGQWPPAGSSCPGCTIACRAGLQGLREHEGEDISPSTAPGCRKTVWLQLTNAPNLIRALQMCHYPGQPRSQLEPSRGGKVHPADRHLQPWGSKSRMHLSKSCASPQSPHCALRGKGNAPRHLKPGLHHPCLRGTACQQDRPPPTQGELFHSTGLPPQHKTPVHQPLSVGRKGNGLNSWQPSTGGTGWQQPNNGVRTCVHGSTTTEVWCSQHTGTCQSAGKGQAKPPAANSGPHLSLHVFPGLWTMGSKLVAGDNAACQSTPCHASWCYPGKPQTMLAPQDAVFMTWGCTPWCQWQLGTAPALGPVEEKPELGLQVSTPSLWGTGRWLEPWYSQLQSCSPAC